MIKVGLNIIDHKILTEKIEYKSNIIRGVILNIFMQRAFWGFL